MAKLPDIQTLGARVIPQSNRAISSYNPAVANDGFEAASRSIRGALQDIENKQAVQARLESSYAEANLLQKQIDITNSLRQDGDYSTYRDRYEKGMAEAAKEAGGMIGSPEARAQFSAQAKLSTVRGLPGIISMADARKIDYTKSSGLENLDKNREAYLNAPDEAMRARIVANTHGLIESMRDAGAIDSETAYATGKKWVEDAAQSRLEMLPPEEQVRLLKPQSQSIPGGFDSAMETVMANEGGYVAIDGASGAPANFGINQRANPDIDVAKLTRDQAKEIYKDRYWSKYGLDDVPPELQTVVFDGVVNHRSDFARELVAAAKNGATVDEILSLRRKEYERLASANPDKYAKSLPGWKNRLNNIGGKTGSFADYIPADRRFDLLRKAEAGQSVQIRQEASAIEDAAKLGLEVPRDRIESVAVKAKEAGMGDLGDQLLRYADVQGATKTFALQGLSHQAKTLSLVKSDIEKGNLDDTPLYEAYANVYKNKLDLLKKDPWQYYVAHGAVNPPQPLNFTDAQDVSKKLAARRADAALVEKIEGGVFKLPALTSGEVEQLKSIYETGTTQQSAAALSAVGSALNDVERRTLAQTMAPKEPMLAIALNLAPDKANKLLEGSKLKGEVPEPKIREIVNQNLSGMVFDPEALESTNAAIYAYYKKLALDGGDFNKVPNDDLVEKAITDVVGKTVTVSPYVSLSGPFYEKNPSKIFTYRGDDGELVDEDRLEDIFRGITDDLLKQSNGGPPYTTNMDYVTAEELRSKTQFRSYGDGLYTAHYPGLGGLIKKDGSPYVFDARQIEKLQKQK